MGEITRYGPLKQELQDDHAASRPSGSQLSRTRKNLTTFLFASLILSVLLNGFLEVRHLRLLSQAQSAFGNIRSAKRFGLMWANELTKVVAGLLRDNPISWTHHTPYTGAENNQSEADVLWNKISVDAGAVALTESYASSKGLPEAQKFPWDDKKGLYLLNGYHNLHCLVWY